MDFIVLDIIVLFGGIQALSLCLYLFFRKTENKQAHRFFLLFLFCIGFFNIGYAAIFMDIQIGAFNMAMHPFPYKYIIAPALFGYVLYSLKPQPIGKWIWILMTPGIIYGLIRCYWLYLILSRKNPFIIKDVFDTGFFTVNETIVLFFNLIIGLYLLRNTQLHLQASSISFGTKKYWTWLKTLSIVFATLAIIHLLLILASYLSIGQHHRLFYYPTLIINSLFVYWIGFVGYSKSSLLFFKPLVKGKTSTPANKAIEEMLSKAMNDDKLFKNPKLTSQQLAAELNLPMNELTKYINIQYDVNFSQYVNGHRTKEAIQLMEMDFLSKYSLDALANEAGFNSKSSFYKVFKDQTGKTPTAYLKALEK